MRSIAPALVILLSLCCLSCDRKRLRPADTSTAASNSAVQAAGADEEQLKAEIGRGLEEQFNLLSIPVGDVEIMSGPGAGENDPQKKQFREEFHNHLNWLEARGLVTLTERTASELPLPSKNRTVNVVPTARAMEGADAKLTTPEQVIIRMATCRVLQIKSNIPYRSPRMAASGDYRLVLGTYSGKATDFMRSVAPEPEHGEFKFRALLQLNPSTKRYEFQRADWGGAQQAGWSTENVR